MSKHHAPTVAALAANVYSGVVAPNKITSVSTFSRSYIESVVSCIQKGLPFDNNPAAPTLRVYRSALARLGHSCKSGVYTSYELRSAIEAVCTGKKSFVDAEDIYGVPPSTLKRKADEVRVALKFATNSDMRKAKSDIDVQRIRSQSRLFSKVKRGPSSYITPVEALLVDQLAVARVEAGQNVGSGDTADDLSELIRAKGAALLLSATTDVQKRRATQMSKAQVSVSYANKILREADTELGVTGDEDLGAHNLFTSPLLLPSYDGGFTTGPSGGAVPGSKKRKFKRFTKTSRLSVKRALAGNVLGDIVMRERVMAMFARRCGRDEAGNVIIPEACDMFGGDEKGLSPEGEHFAAHNGTMGRAAAQAAHVRRSTVVTDDRNSYWTSLYFTTCGDGTFLDMMVIHKGGTTTGTTMPGHISMNLPPNFIVSETPSGYMTQPEFEKAILQLHEYRKKQKREHIPSFFFMDAHDSHWGSVGLDFCLKHNIFPFFLRSNNSTEDQPNDNGSNAVVQAAYTKAQLRWRKKYPGVPFSKPYQNMVISDMWKAMTNAADGSAANLARVVKKSWEVTGLCPFVSSAMLTTVRAEDSDATKAYRASVAAATKLAIPLMDAARAKEATTALAILEQRQRAAVVGLPVVEERFARVTVTVSYVTRAELDMDDSVGENTTITKFAVSEAAHRWANTSLVVPALQLRGELAAVAKAKALRVPKQKDVLVQANPSTALSLEVVEVTVANRVAAQAAKEAEDAKKKQSKLAGAEKMVETRTKNAAAWKRVQVMSRSTPPQDWKKLLVGELWSAVGGSGGPAAPKGATKAVAIAMIEARLATWVPAAGDEEIEVLEEAAPEEEAAPDEEEEEEEEEQQEEEEEEEEEEDDDEEENEGLPSKRHRTSYN